MVSAVLTLPLFAALFGLMTLGAVLLVRFYLASLTRSTRVLVASVLPPIALSVPATLISLLEGDADLADVMLVLLVGGGLLAVLFCWPFAYFATKRLDRLTQFDAETFT